MTNEEIKLSARSHRNPGPYNQPTSLFFSRLSRPILPIPSSCPFALWLCLPLKVFEKVIDFILFPQYISFSFYCTAWWSLINFLNGEKQIWLSLGSPSPGTGGKNLLMCYGGLMSNLCVLCKALSYNSLWVQERLLRVGCQKNTSLLGVGWKHFRGKCVLS